MLRPAGAAVLGVVTTTALVGSVAYWLLRTGGPTAVTDNAALITASIALGGVLTTQLVGIALEERRAGEARALEADRAEEAKLQRYLEQVGASVCHTSTSVPSGILNPTTSRS